MDTIRHQHEPGKGDTDMMACFFAANQTSKQLGYDFGGNLVLEPLPPTVAQRLGGTLEEVVASLGDMDPLVEEAKMFSNLS